MFSAGGYRRSAAAVALFSTVCGYTTHGIKIPWCGICSHATAFLVTSQLLAICSVAMVNRNENENSQSNRN